MVLVLLRYEYGTVQFINKPLLVRQTSKILRHLDTVLIQHHQFNMLGITLTAQQQPDRWILVWLHVIFLHILEVQFHLTLVLWLEFPQFQIDGHKTL